MGVQDDPPLQIGAVNRRVKYYLLMPRVLRECRLHGSDHEHPSHIFFASQGRCLSYVIRLQYSDPLASQAGS